LLLQVLFQSVQLVLGHWKLLSLHQQSPEVGNEGVGSHHTEDRPNALLRYMESVADALVMLKLVQQRWGQSFQKDHGILQSADLCREREEKMYIKALS
jgi:hypothetical protein